jgi:hypothetical protein
MKDLCLSIIGALMRPTYSSRYWFAQTPVWARMYHKGLLTTTCRNYKQYKQIIALHLITLSKIFNFYTFSLSLAPLRHLLQHTGGFCFVFFFFIVLDFLIFSFIFLYSIIFNLIYLLKRIRCIFLLHKDGLKVN